MKSFRINSIGNFNRDGLKIQGVVKTEYKGKTKHYLSNGRGFG